MGPVGLGTKCHWAGEGEKQFSIQSVVSYSFSSRKSATISDQTEDFPVYSCMELYVCKSERLLQLRVICLQLV
jgi:hypothetical protein